MWRNDGFDGARNHRAAAILLPTSLPTLEASNRSTEMPRLSWRYLVPGLAFLAAGAIVLISPPPDEIALMARGEAERLLVQGRSILALAYARSPVIVVGLAALIVLPIAAMVAATARWLGRERTRATAMQPLAAKLRRDLPMTRVSAWIEVDGEQGRRHKINRDMLTIGREIDCDVTLDGPSIAPTHVLIQRQSSGALLAVDASGEGFQVNGQLSHGLRLVDGDRIRVGGCRLTVMIRGQSLAA